MRCNHGLCILDPSNLNHSFPEIKNFSISTNYHKGLDQFQLKLHQDTKGLKGYPICKEILLLAVIEERELEFYLLKSKRESKALIIKT